VRWTAEIGPFVILSEASVGAGARRIEAVTSAEAYALLHGARHESEELRRELEAARKTARKPKTEGDAADFTIVDKDENVVLVEAKNLSGGPLRDLSDRIRQQEKVGAAVLASVANGRVYLVVNLDDSFVERGLDAASFVKRLGPIIGGGGGGRPSLAEAGGKNLDASSDVLRAAKDEITAALK
jgi:alanyl-tRNA synthetase